MLTIKNKGSRPHLCGLLPQVEHHASLISRRSGLTLGNRKSSPAVFSEHVRKGFENEI